MRKISRKHFLYQSLAGLGATFYLPGLATIARFRKQFSSLTYPIGFQVYPIRELLVKDFAGTLKMMADMGYKAVEMCSPSGYISSGFQPLVNMKPSQMRQVIHETGLICQSCHFTFDELKNNLDDRMDFAHQLGLTQMICSSFWIPNATSLKEYIDSAQELNKIATITKKNGLQMGFHNHDMEFRQLEGKLIYDVLLEELDPQLVKMQFQTEVITLGFKGSDYFRKYPGRFISSHLSDWTADKKQVPIGQGVIDWKDFFAAAQTGGVQNIFVEMDPGTFKESIRYLQGIV